jgi:hypothetical protein
VAAAPSQDQQYTAAAERFAPAIERLARGYEADAELRRDLVQEIHAQLWRSFSSRAESQTYQGAGAGARSSLDHQVPPEANLAAIKAALTDNPDATAMEVAGAQSLFQTAKTGAVGNMPTFPKRSRRSPCRRWVTGWSSGSSASELAKNGWRMSPAAAIPYKSNEGDGEWGLCRRRSTIPQSGTRG